MEMGLNPSPAFLERGLTKPFVQSATASGGTLPLAQAMAQSLMDSAPYGVLRSAERCVLRPFAMPGCAALRSDLMRLATLAVVIFDSSLVVETRPAC